MSSQDDEQSQMSWPDVADSALSGLVWIIIITLFLFFANYKDLFEAWRKTFPLTQCVPVVVEQPVAK